MGEEWGKGVNNAGRGDKKIFTMVSKTEVSFTSVSTRILEYSWSL